MPFTYKGLFSLLCVVSLSTMAVAQALPDSADVLVLKVGEQTPQGAKPLGKIKVVDGGLKLVCGYDKTIEQAKDKARKKGANIILITELKLPDGKTSCYRVWGDVFYADDVTEYIAASKAFFNAQLNNIVPDTASYAVICVFRPKGGYGFAVNYKLHIGDSTEQYIHNGSKLALKVYKPGPITLWAKTESRTEVTLDVQPGKVYFLKCSVKFGAIIGRPNLTVLDTAPGLDEYTALKASPEVKEQPDAVYQ